MAKVKNVFYLHLWQLIGWAEVDDIVISEWKTEEVVFTETFESFTPFETTSGVAYGDWKIVVHKSGAIYMLALPKEEE